MTACACCAETPYLLGKRIPLTRLTNSHYLKSTIPYYLSSQIGLYIYICTTLALTNSTPLEDVDSTCTILTIIIEKNHRNNNF